jgi:hypothetical protein
MWKFRFSSPTRILGWFPRLSQGRREKVKNTWDSNSETDDLGNFDDRH